MRREETRYRRTVEILEQHADGGATVRLSQVELTRMFNGLVQLLQPPLTWADGSDIPRDVLHPLRLQLHQVARLIGRKDIPHPDRD